MNEDQGSPPPIPPYRPERVEAGPQDSRDEPGPLDRAPDRTDPAAAGKRAKDAPLTDRQRALESLEAKAEFRGHLTIYLLVMALLVGIWAFTTGFSGFFWPIFPMMGWGLGVAIHGVSLGWDKDPTEEEINAEIERLRRRQSRGRLEE
ncbi:2TM domain-containing protein [Ornithinimicrobium sufpigmenti]|uniref:2TM domain-containing protein n=1 Tax=Ornithinimicrobium sufpigmenti TaxID=2508882 RepID=UPI001EDF576B|nr:MULTISPECIES: 2TM domain-containing protein [unclassified Ornithinimicrobium]